MIRLIVENRLINKNETDWLNALLIVDFDEKVELIRQINQAEIGREYTKYYLSIKFKVSRKAVPLNMRIRVPIEMRVFRRDFSPIQFLLHIVDGYISELEIFCADSSEIDSNIRLERIEVILAEELRA